MRTIIEKAGTRRVKNEEEIVVVVIVFSANQIPWGICIKTNGLK